MRNRTTTLVSIPKPFLRALRWAQGDHVRLELDGDRLIVTSIQAHVVAITSPRAGEGHGG
jgi:antitoxin component of MazEF toxin-antitoxin module